MIYLFILRISNNRVCKIVGGSFIWEGNKIAVKQVQ